jgi:hypothetical protein
MERVSGARQGGTEYWRRAKKISRRTPAQIQKSAAQPPPWHRVDLEEYIIESYAYAFMG